MSIEESIQYLKAYARKTVVKFRLDGRLRHLCGDSSADPMPSS
jgi:hypothetical protein